MRKGVLLFSVLGLLPTAVLAQSKIEPPVPVRTVAPEYPEALRRDHVSGLVIVTIEVNVQGNVVSAAIDKSSNSEFNDPALAALKKWRFKPARQNGAPVPATVKIPVKFNEERGA